MQHPVDVWTVSLLEFQCSQSVLSEDEVARRNRFKFEKDRVRWSAARSALRVILSKYAGTDAAQIGFAVGKHGKPSLLDGGDIEFNLSHAGDWALIAVARIVPVGVDIEQIRDGLDMAPLLQRLGESDHPGTPKELCQRWTRREARSKAAGGALFDRLPDSIRAVDLAAPAGYAASVALTGGDAAVRYCGGNL
jgi:4'-phosphopantetheinyl transferase